MSIREQTACFTGHRVVNETDIPGLHQKLDVILSRLVDNGVIYWGNGGCRGYDFISALAVMRARNIYPFIKLIMVLPCYNQEKLWNTEDKRIYSHLLESADKVVYVSKEPYFDGCMIKRNLYLIQHSSACVAYMKYEKSGTSQTVRLAREHGLTVFNIATEL